MANLTRPYFVVFECTQCGAKQVKMRNAYLDARYLEGGLRDCIVVNGDCLECGSNLNFPLPIFEFLQAKSLAYRPN